MVSAPQKWVCAAHHSGTMLPITEREGERERERKFNRFRNAFDRYITAVDDLSRLGETALSKWKGERVRNSIV